MMWKALETRNGDVSIWRVGREHENGEVEYCGATFRTRTVAQDAALEAIQLASTAQRYLDRFGPPRAYG